VKTDIYTYFTVPSGETELLYSSENWVRIELQLETAGPVSVGTREEVSPVLSGKGILLPTGDESIEFVLPKGNRLYVASGSINRVKVIVEPIPWIEQLLMQIESGFGGLRGILGAIARNSGAKPSPKNEPPCPPSFTVPRLKR